MGERATYVSQSAGEENRSEHLAIYESLSTRTYCNGVYSLSLPLHEPARLQVNPTSRVHHRHINSNCCLIFSGMGLDSSSSPTACLKLKRGCSFQSRRRHFDVATTSPVCACLYKIWPNNGFNKILCEEMKNKMNVSKFAQPRL